MDRDHFERVLKESGVGMTTKRKLRKAFDATEGGTSTPAASTSKTTSRSTPRGHGAAAQITEPMTEL